MSMKRCFGLSLSPSVSLLGRAILVGGVLSSAAACARHDAGKTDTTVALADSATTATTTTTSVTPASAVESVSTGETTISAESKANPSVAATNVTTGTAKVDAKPAAATAHHAVHHTDSAMKAAPGAATKAAPTTTAAAPAAAADTGQKTAAAAGGVDHLVVSPQEYEGWKMFSVYCYRCHGVDAMGGGIAPNLRHSVSSEGIVTHEVFITTVTNGRLEKGMPTWKALLSPEQMEDLWLYVIARSSNRLYPGRPHMAQGANP
jgi:mono/diheme cytochrome c family protein